MKILIIDRPEEAQTYEAIVSSFGHEALIATTRHDAIAMIENHAEECDVLLAAQYFRYPHRFPGITGLELLLGARGKNQNIRGIILGNSMQGMAVTRRLADFVLDKQFSKDSLREALEAVS